MNAPQTSRADSLIRYLSAVEPLLVADNTIYSLGRRQSQGACYRTASGEILGLRRLGRVDDLQRPLRPSPAELEERVQAAVFTNGDPLKRLFARFLVLTSLLERSHLEPLPQTAVSEMQREVTGSVEPWAKQSVQSRHGLASIRESVGAATHELPAFQLPQPAWLMHGNAWRLVPADFEDDRRRIRTPDARWLKPDTCLGLGELLSQFERALTDWIGRVAADVRRIRPEVGSQRLDESFQALTHRGYFCMDDLLFVRRDSTQSPWVGCILPAHHNISLGRYCNGDLAIGSEFAFDPTRTPSLSAFAFRADRWRHEPLPHGTCLGATPPSYTGSVPQLAFFHYLRRAAVLFAANARFHSSDQEHNDVAEDTYG